MSRLFAPADTTPAPSDDLDALVEAIDRLVDERRVTLQELARIDAEIADALIRDETFAEAEALERRKADLARKVARSNLVLPRLDARRAQAALDLRCRKAAEHILSAGAAYDALATALKAALAANDAAAKAFAAANADLGDAASLNVPRVGFTHLTKASFDFWSAAVEEALGRRPRRTMAAPPGKLVRIIAHNVRAFGVDTAATYVRGDEASFPPTEARRLVSVGQAVFVDPNDLKLLPPDPRAAPAPEPDESGQLEIVFVRVARGADGSAYGIGDIARFTAAAAVGLVRRGAADFLPTTSNGTRGAPKPGT